MNNDTTNSGKQQSRARNVFVLKTNILNSGIGGLRMRTSLAYRAAYVTGIHLSLADSTQQNHWNEVRTTGGIICVKTIKNVSLSNIHTHTHTY
jgi:hypothetical protein